MMNKKFQARLQDFTRSALERMVAELMTAEDGEEKKILSKLSGKKNDLADLDEEMHGKPSVPKVTEDDLPYEGDDELPDVPTKKKGRK